MDKLKTTGEARTIAQAAWIHAFTSGPYSSLKMIEHLVKKADMTWHDLIVKPGALFDFSATKMSSENPDSLRETWSSSSGRCTSFALNVAHALQTTNPKTFDFSTYDIHGNRVARCTKTCLLIESGSPTGVFTVPEGPKWVIADEKTKYRYYQQTLSTQAVIRDGSIKEMSTSETLSANQAMTRCLQEVARDMTLSVLFRSFEDNQAHFHGYIKWQIAQKPRCLEMTPKSGRKTIILWDGSGTEETEKYCRLFVSRFVVDSGGPHGESQWSADGINQIHEAVWNAMNDTCGYPILQTE